MNKNNHKRSLCNVYGGCSSLGSEELCTLENYVRFEREGRRFLKIRLNIDEISEPLVPRGGDHSPEYRAWCQHELNHLVRDYDDDYSDNLAIEMNSKSQDTKLLCKHQEPKFMNGHALGGVKDIRCDENYGICTWDRYIKFEMRGRTYILFKYLDSPIVDEPLIPPGEEASGEFMSWCRDEISRKRHRQRKMNYGY